VRLPFTIKLGNALMQPPGLSDEYHVHMAGFWRESFKIIIRATSSSRW